MICKRVEKNVNQFFMLKSNAPLFFYHQFSVHSNLLVKIVLSYMSGIRILLALHCFGTFCVFIPFSIVQDLLFGIFNQGLVKITLFNQISKFYKIKIKYSEVLHTNFGLFLTLKSKIVGTKCRMKLFGQLCWQKNVQLGNVRSSNWDLASLNFYVHIFVKFLLAR